MTRFWVINQTARNKTKQNKTIELYLCWYTQVLLSEHELSEFHITSGAWVKKGANQHCVECVCRFRFIWTIFYVQIELIGTRMKYSNNCSLIFNVTIEYCAIFRKKVYTYIQTLWTSSQWWRHFTFLSNFIIRWLWTPKIIAQVSFSNALSWLPYMIS